MVWWFDFPRIYEDVANDLVGQPTCSIFTRLLNYAVLTYCQCQMQIYQLRYLFSSGTLFKYCQGGNDVLVMLYW